MSRFRGVGYQRFCRDFVKLDRVARGQIYLVWYPFGTRFRALSRLIVVDARYRRSVVATADVPTHSLANHHPIGSSTGVAEASRGDWSALVDEAYKVSRFAVELSAFRGMSFQGCWRSCEQSRGCRSAMSVCTRLSSTRISTSRSSCSSWAGATTAFRLPRAGRQPAAHHQRNATRVFRRSHLPLVYGVARKARALGMDARAGSRLRLAGQSPH